MNAIRTMLLPALIAVAGCAVNPVSGERELSVMSERDEVRAGRQGHQQILRQYGVYDDPGLQAYVERIGQSLARVSHRAHLDYTFTVLDSPEINAFALPGGYIYVTRGILAYLESEAELAGVLGHEIGHVTAKHGARQRTGRVATDVLSVLATVFTGVAEVGDATQAIGTGFVRGYGRDHELEADRLGAEYLHRAGYDPDAMLEVIGVLKDQETYEVRMAKQEGREPNTYHGVFSTHPRNDDRLKTVVRAARKLSEKDYRDANRKGYLATIDGIVWGPSTRNGIVDRNRFSHPGLGFSIQFPESWEVINTSQSVAARAPDGGGVMQLALVPRQTDEPPAAMIRRLTGDKSLEIRRSRGMASATVPVTAGDNRQDARFYVIPLDDTQALTLLGTAAAKDFGTVEGRTGEVASSFRRLDAAQIAAIPVQRLRIIDGPPKSFPDLAKSSALGSDAVNRLRLLNRSYPRGPITSLGAVKTVIVDDR